MTELSWSAVLAHRCERQGLAVHQPADRALEVVAEICGLRAQLLSSAEMSLAARILALTGSDELAERLTDSGGGHTQASLVSWAPDLRSE